LTSYCQNCNKLCSKQRHEDNKEYKKQYNKEHREEKFLYNTQYYKDHNEEILVQKGEYYQNNKEQILASGKIYRHKPEVKQRIHNRHKEKKKTDINYYLACILRVRLANAIKRGTKSGSAVRDLGCSITEFKTYMEKLFWPGMSWENRGQWQIDHIIPISSFDLTDREQFLRACHYTNLQPLWAKDNLSKGNRISV
jgi:hypothetical protein